MEALSPNKEITCKFCSVAVLSLKNEDKSCCMAALLPNEEIKFCCAVALSLKNEGTSNHVVWRHYLLTKKLYVNGVVWRPYLLKMKVNLAVCYIAALSPNEEINCCCVAALSVDIEGKSCCVAAPSHNDEGESRFVAVLPLIDEDTPVVWRL